MLEVFYILHANRHRERHYRHGTDTEPDLNNAADVDRRHVPTCSRMSVKQVEVQTVGRPQIKRNKV